MGRQSLIIGLGFLALAAFAGFLGWAFFAVSAHGGGWRVVGPVWPFVAAGLLTVGAVGAFFMWLTFYSANHGYDDRAGKDDG